MRLKIKQTKQNVVFLILGRLIAYGILYVGTIAFVIWTFCQNTIY